MAVEEGTRNVARTDSSDSSSARLSSHVVEVRRKYVAPRCSIIRLDQVVRGTGGGTPERRGTFKTGG